MTVTELENLIRNNEINFSAPITIELHAGVRNDIVKLAQLLSNNQLTFNQLQLSVAPQDSNFFIEQFASINPVPVIHDLSLNISGLLSTAWQRFFAALPNFKSLRSLDISNSNFDYIRDCSALVQYLSSNPILEKLDITNEKKFDDETYLSGSEEENLFLCLQNNTHLSSFSYGSATGFTSAIYENLSARVREKLFANRKQDQRESIDTAKIFKASRITEKRLHEAIIRCFHEASFDSNLHGVNEFQLSGNFIDAKEKLVSLKSQLNLFSYDEQSIKSNKYNELLAIFSHYMKAYHLSLALNGLRYSTCSASEDDRVTLNKSRKLIVEEIVIIYSNNQWNKISKLISDQSARSHGICQATHEMLQSLHGKELIRHVKCILEEMSKSEPSYNLENIISSEARVERLVDREIRLSDLINHKRAIARQSANITVKITFINTKEKVDDLIEILSDENLNLKQLSIAVDHTVADYFIKKLSDMNPKPALISLSLPNIKLSRESWRYFFERLDGFHLLTSLSVKNSNFDYAGDLVCLGKYLAKNPILNEIDISDTTKHDDKTFLTGANEKILFDYIKANTHLTTFKYGEDRPFIRELDDTLSKRILDKLIINAESTQLQRMSAVSVDIFNQEQKVAKIFNDLEALIKHTIAQCNESSLLLNTASLKQKIDFLSLQVRAASLDHEFKSTEIFAEITKKYTYFNSQLVLILSLGELSQRASKASAHDKAILDTLRNDLLNGWRTVNNNQDMPEFINAALQQCSVAADKVKDKSIAAVLLNLALVLSGILTLGISLAIYAVVTKSSRTETGSFFFKRAELSKDCITRVSENIHSVKNNNFSRIG